MNAEATKTEAGKATEAAAVAEQGANVEITDTLARLEEQINHPLCTRYALPQRIRPFFRRYRAMSEHEEQVRRLLDECAQLRQENAHLRAILASHDLLPKTAVEVSQPAAMKPVLSRIPLRRRRS